VLLGLGVAGVVVPPLAFLLMTGGTGMALAGALALAGLGGGVSAVGAVATAEQFPGEGRLSGLAFGATGATAIFGGFAPYVAQIVTERTSAPVVPGAMIAIVALAVLPVLWRMRETRPEKALGGDAAKPRRRT
jgi:MFS transporter, MHS family, proline/betaine transporter